MPAPADLETAAATLYAGPREDFIATRAQLAKAAKAGDGELAARIGALGKPSTTAWAVNRVWWEAPEVIRELFAAANDLRVTLAGGGGPHGTEPVRARHRKAALAATTRATQALPGTVSIATRRRIATTIEALGALGRFPTPGPGCLAEDLDPPGFESLGAMPELGHGDAEVQEAGANEGALAALSEATSVVRRAAARLDTCRDQHDALLAVHREALARVEEADAALARARLHHEACVTAAQATARDLGQREAELTEATAAHAKAMGVLEALRADA